MEKYLCGLCGYVYDPAEGDADNDISAGTSFNDLPDDWVCPVCGAGKEEFSPTDQYKIWRYKEQFVFYIFKLLCLLIRGRQVQLLSVSFCDEKERMNMPIAVKIKRN